MVDPQSSLRLHEGLQEKEAQRDPSEVDHQRRNRLEGWQGREGAPHDQKGEHLPVLLHAPQPIGCGLERGPRHGVIATVRSLAVPTLTRVREGAPHGREP